MAQASLIPKNGALTIATIIADYNSFSIQSRQMVADVTPYGSNVNAKRVGNGTAGLTLTVGAFALKTASNTPLLLPTMGAASGAVAAAGVAVTATLDTSVTESGNFVMESMSVSHGRMQAAVPIAMSMQSAGDITESWIAS